MVQAAIAWAPAMLPMLVFGVILTLPGAIALWAAGMRTSHALVLGPVVTTALVGAGAVLLSVAGVPWNVGSFGGLTAGAIITVGLIRFLMVGKRFTLARPARPFLSPMRLWAAAGLLVNAVLVGWLYMRPTVTPDAVAYEYDTIWHFTVIEWILRTGDASSLNTGLVDGTVGTHFYPAAWQAMVALTSQITGAALPPAVHGSILFILFVYWPVGLLWLSRTLVRLSPVAGFAVTALSFLPAVFPIGFFTFGLLYPNFFSYALMPACLVLLIAVLRSLGARRWAELRVEWLARLLAVLSVPVAFLFAQPNSAFTLLVILLPLVYLVVFRLIADASPRRARWAPWVGVALFTVLFSVVWVVLHDSSFLERTVAVDVWRRYESMSQAMGDWLFLGKNSEGQLALGALSIAGLVVMLRTRQSRWWVASYVIVGTLFVVAAAMGRHLDIRSYLVGFWYADAVRLAAPAALLTIPLIALAVDAIADKTAHLIRPPQPRRRLVATAVVLLTLGTVVFSLNEPTLKDRRIVLQEKSAVNEAQWVSPPEEAFMERVRRSVGPDAVVANDPFDGSAMAYSLDGINVLFPALPGNWMGVASPDQKTIMNSLFRVSRDPEVCAAVERLGVEYVMRLEVGERGMFGYAPELFRGIIASGPSNGFDLVLSDGDLALYRVPDCSD